MLARAFDVVCGEGSGAYGCDEEADGDCLLGTRHFGNGWFVQRETCLWWMTLVAVGLLETWAVQLVTVVLGSWTGVIH